MNVCINITIGKKANKKITLNTNELQLGTTQSTQPDTETNLIAGLTWKDGQIDENNGGNFTKGTDKCLIDIQIPATGLYKLSVTANYTYLKILSVN